MCELFGMSSDRPISALTSLSLFGNRGGKPRTTPTVGGWPISKAMRSPSTKRPKRRHAASFSKLAEQTHSQLIIAHVRRANPPTAHTLENTHPFMQTCCGRPWVFAHNGQVPEVVAAQGCCHPRHSHPGGETDSEHAFIYLFEEIAATFPTFQSASSETMDAWFETLMTRSTAIAAYGQFNFLMSDGEHLIAYGHDRLYSQQRMEGGVQSVLIASAPLPSDGPWEVFVPGELRVYRGGRLLGRCCAGMTQPCARAIASP